MTDSLKRIDIIIESDQPEDPEDPNQYNLLILVGCIIIATVILWK